jgi:hypothetical protein
MNCVKTNFGLKPIIVFLAVDDLSAVAELKTFIESSKKISEEEASRMVKHISKDATSIETHRVDA